MCQIEQNVWGRTGFSVKSVEPLQKDNMLHAKLIGLEKGSCAKSFFVLVCLESRMIWFSTIRSD